MTTLNISLPEAMRAFIDEQIAKGGYITASEYIRQLVRAAQKRQAQERLEELLLEGLDSGEPTPMTAQDWDDIRRQALERLGSRDPQ